MKSRKHRIVVFGTLGAAVASTGAIRAEAAHHGEAALRAETAAPADATRLTNTGGMNQAPDGYAVADSPQLTFAASTLPDSYSTTLPYRMIRALLYAAVPGVQLKPILTVPSLLTGGNAAQHLLPTTVSDAAPATPAPSGPEATPTVRVALIVTPASTPAAPADAPAPNAVATPAMLPSRHEDQQMLAQLTADLNRANSRLNEANQALGEGQRQLSSFTNVLQQAMMEDGSDASGLHPFVRVAMRYAGTPYVWGGESRDGFDCSGFIIRVMRDLGYEAPPHSAAEQFNCGKPIAQELLKPGDLVFFANTYKPGISHVGIYLGHRRFIQAAGTGKGTIVSSLDDAHYQAKYAGARRLLPVSSN